MITPEVLEEAIEWLKKHPYCCHALSCALDDCSYALSSDESDHAAIVFLHPLLARDNISKDGAWTYANTDYAITFPTSREEWLRKIAQELREGKLEPHAFLGFTFVPV